MQLGCGMSDSRLGRHTKATAVYLAGNVAGNGYISSVYVRMNLERPSPVGIPIIVSITPGFVRVSIALFAVPNIYSQTKVYEFYSTHKGIFSGLKIDRSNDEPGSRLKPLFEREFRFEPPIVDNANICSGQNVSDGAPFGLRHVMNEFEKALLQSGKPLGAHPLTPALFGDADDVTEFRVLLHFPAACSKHSNHAIGDMQVTFCMRFDKF